MRARQATEELAREGVTVRFVRTVFVPEDETCLYLFEAVSADDVRQAVRRADLPFERVSEAVALPTARGIETPDRGRMAPKEVEP